MRNIYIKTPGALTLFLIQYISLGYLVLSGRVYPLEWFCWLPYLVGFALGIWALFAMGSKNLNAGPDVLPSGRLVTRGPYRLIRHPMYAAILLVIIPLVLTNATRVRMVVLLLLILNLILKIRYEETRLLKRFEAYAEYSSSTWRLLPYIY